MIGKGFIRSPREGLYERFGRGVSRRDGAQGMKFVLGGGDASFGDGDSGGGVLEPKEVAFYEWRNCVFYFI